jgi:nucleolar pre-ribosomal-associated protein 1
VQHPKFFAICNPSALPTVRDAVIQLLRELFFAHPQNSCQPSHIEPLRAIYGGTLSVSDRTILSILHLFEVHRKLSCASLLFTWSSSGDTGSTDALNTVLSLDAGKVFHTCLNFPRGLKFDLDHEYHDESEFREELYDPLFLILIFARVVSGNGPSSAFSWVQFFRTNILCAVIRSLSSKDDTFRELAVWNLSGLWRLLDVRTQTQQV